jgi:hypothetical protein
MAQQLDKIFPCLTCKKEIKLARNDTNTGWLRFNLDETPHVDEKTSKQSQIAALQSEVAQLRSEMKIMITQLQGLRSDTKELKAKK